MIVMDGELMVGVAMMFTKHCKKLETTQYLQQFSDRLSVGKSKTPTQILEVSSKTKINSGMG